MPFSVIDPAEFLADGVFLEGKFLEKANNFDWGQHEGKQVLVRGCNSAVIPPWAFMYITGQLVPFAKSVRFGNEHDNLVVFRAEKK